METPPPGPCASEAGAGETPPMTRTLIGPGSGAGVVMRQYTASSYNSRVRLTHLSLQNFRNFLELELDLVPGVTVLFGGNAQGKTNLLEAVYMLATARSVRAESERELINWSSAETDEIPYTRIKGTFQRLNSPVRLEMVVQLERASLVEASQLQKRGWVNGVPKRAGDLVGEVNAVLFTPQDIELVHGPPSIRRHYLNILLSQADRAVLRELQRYARVLAQRNSLLKAIRERRASPRELVFWDKELIESGTAITAQRLEAMSALQGLTRDIHRELTASDEDLQVVYKPSVRAGEGVDLKAAFTAGLSAMRDREVFAGMSLMGPHRDDFGFSISGRDMAAFASRGQQRTASLALKLAEARYLARRAGDPPVLLLDDVFSELDGRRQAFLLAWIANWEQALLTTAEPERIDRRVSVPVTMLEVTSGQISRAL